MKRTILAMALAVAAMTGYAQKFALIDMDYILKNIPAYERANEQLSQVSKKWQAEVEALTLEASTMYKNYQNEVVFLSQEQKKARQEARAAAATDPAQEPKRKRGRPRKNPLPEQCPEIILPEEAPAPVREEPPAVQIMTIQRASIFPNVDKMEPPCTPEEFAKKFC